MQFCPSLRAHVDVVAAARHNPRLLAAIRSRFFAGAISAVCSLANLGAAGQAIAQQAMPAAAESSVVSWQVVNRFPVFRNSEVFARIAGVADERGNAREALWRVGASAESVMKDPRFYKQLRAHLPISAETAWQEHEQLYDASILFREENHIVATSVEIGEDCLWELRGPMMSAVDYELETAPAVSQVRGSCAQSPHLRVPNISQPYRLRLTRVNPALLLETDVRIEQKLIVALGDSFASGEGNPDHPAKFEKSVDNRRLKHDWYLGNYSSQVLLAGNSAQWWDLACHRSLLAWPSMAALKQAINEPHSVVQFASFACSGAEIYDGLFNPQVEPPGFEYMTNPAKGKFSGGKYSVQLQRSQLQALAQLLCNGQVNSENIAYIENESIAVRAGQRPFFGKFEAPRCKTNPRSVSKLYFMFGGNDTGFSRVIFKGLYPQLAKYKLPGYAPLINNGLFMKLDPVEPNVAYNRGIIQLPTLYQHVRRGFVAMGIRPEDTTMVAYPDLLGPALDLPRPKRVQCNNRTADGFSPFQILVGREIKNANLRFGLRIIELKEPARPIKEEYIDQLRAAMAKSQEGQIMPGKTEKFWNFVDSNDLFAKHHICAVSDACTGDVCPQADRVRWSWSFLDNELSPWDEAVCKRRNQERKEGQRGPRSHVVHFCGAKGWDKPSEFELYDPSREAGVRYGTDILLGAARVDSARKNQIRNSFTRLGLAYALDGLYGVAHPTAHMHSKIADRVLP